MTGRRFGEYGHSYDDPGVQHHAAVRAGGDAGMAGGGAGDDCDGRGALDDSPTKAGLGRAIWREGLFALWREFAGACGVLCAVRREAGRVAGSC